VAALLRTKRTASSVGEVIRQACLFLPRHAATQCKLHLLAHALVQPYASLYKHICCRLDPGSTRQPTCYLYLWQLRVLVALLYVVLLGCSPSDG
jgi:hypothetical protein